MDRTTVFVSYSRRDRDFLDRLNVHLTPLEHAGRIQSWDDTRIDAGAKWRDEIRNGLQSARVAVLLVSGDFFASSFIAENELPPLLRAAQEDGLIILPVIVRSCLYEDLPQLRDFQAVNDPRKPIAGMEDDEAEQVFVEVARRIIRHLAERPARATAPRPTPWPGSMRAPVIGDLEGVWGEVDRETLGRVEMLEVMASTAHSTLQKCRLDGEMCVLKGTRESLCNVEAMRMLVTGERGPGPTGITWRPRAMSTPRAIWKHDKHVWELQRYHEARSLASIAKRDQKLFTGAQLHEIVHTLVGILEVLNDKKLVHRDINPGNILMREDTGEILLVDWSFCCRQGSAQAPVITAGYSAPEQVVGRAVCESDWYSFAATCFALATGFTLEDVDDAGIEQGLREIHLDPPSYLGWPEAEYFGKLLHRKPAARPRPWAPNKAVRQRFDIGRSSGAVDHRTPLAWYERLAASESSFSWAGRLVKAVWHG